MEKTLAEIARQLRDANKKVQLIYAFNGSGKTRLSLEFKHLIAPKFENGEETEGGRAKILYYNAFTEDLFYWDNDLEGDAARKLKIQPNSFTDWVLFEQGQDQNIITNFQHYTDEKLTPRFNEEYKIRDKDQKEIIVPAFSEVTFSIERGNEERTEHIKISKGEESNFIWCVFFSLLEQIVEVLNVPESDDRETNQFDQLEYVFIDDPVSSLDDNHLIELAVHIAELIKISESDLKFIITSHNPLFYNVLHNELNSKDSRTNYRQKDLKKYKLVKLEDGSFSLINQPNDSPFSYHLFLMSELEKAISSDQIHKYHFNFLRNILEKTSTFLGYNKWGDLLPQTDDGRPNPYKARLINVSSHSKYSGEEVTVIEENDKRVLRYLVQQISEMYHFKSFNPEVSK